MMLYKSVLSSHSVWKLQKMSHSKISQKQTSNNANTNANNIFEDREDAKLILQLESAIGQSPKFDLEKFKSSLESKV